MKQLSASELLQVWDSGGQQPLPERSLHLLAAAFPAFSPDDLAHFSIGERDAGLLLLRERLFGRRLVNVMRCPRCSGLAEWETDLADLCLQSFPPLAPRQDFLLESEGFLVRFRLPTSNDLFRAAGDPAAYPDPKSLLCDCILEVQGGQQAPAASDLPETVLVAVSRRMGAEDPQSDIWMLLCCPDCSHQWEAQFDIVSYLWTEIDNWARHLLQEVAVLAGAFGWSEQQILDLSPQRRQCYLEMIRS